MLVNFYQDLHNATKRDYLARMNDDKVHCMQVARRFNKDFFDGERRYGYGGYVYDGRHKPMAEKIIEHYKLDKNSTVLDIGCGKGHLIHEINKICDCKISGCEISQYAIAWAIAYTRIPHIFAIDLNNTDTYLNMQFDLILCVNVLHNLALPELERAFATINRCAKNAYIVLDSYRTEQELFNLQCWALTAEQFLRPEEWEWLFKKFGYKGDWEYIFYP